MSYSVNQSVDENLNKYEAVTLQTIHVPLLQESEKTERTETAKNQPATVNPGLSLTDFASDSVLNPVQREGQEPLVSNALTPIKNDPDYSDLENLGNLGSATDETFSFLRSLAPLCPPPAPPTPALLPHVASTPYPLTLLPLPPPPTSKHSSLSASPIPFQLPSFNPLSSTPFIGSFPPPPNPFSSIRFPSSTSSSSSLSLSHVEREEDLEMEEEEEVEGEGGVEAREGEGAGVVKMPLFKSLKDLSNRATYIQEVNDLESTVEAFTNLPHLILEKEILNSKEKMSKAYISIRKLFRKYLKLRIRKRSNYTPELCSEILTTLVPSWFLRNALRSVEKANLLYAWRLFARKDFYSPTDTPLKHNNCGTPIQLLANSFSKLPANPQNLTDSLQAIDKILLEYYSDSGDYVWSEVSPDFTKREQHIQLKIAPEKLIPIQNLKNHALYKSDKKFQCYVESILAQLEQRLYTGPKRDPVIKKISKKKKKPAVVINWEAESVMDAVAAIDSELFKIIPKKMQSELKAAYQSLSASIVDSWSKEQNHLNLRTLLTPFNGKRSFNLTKEGTNFNIPAFIKDILSPFYTFYEIKCKLGQESIKKRLHIALLKDALRTVHLEADPTNMNFLKILKEIYNSPFDEKFLEIVTETLHQNWKETPKVLLLKTSEKSNYLAGLRDTLFLMTLLQVKMRSANVEAVMTEPSENQATKITAGCFLFYKEGKIEIYPLKLEFVTSSYSLIAIGSDEDREIAKEMQKEIPALSKQTLHNSAFIIEGSESEQILNYYLEHSENFYLLTAPPEDFLKNKSKTSTEGESKERAEGIEEEDGEEEFTFSDYLDSLKHKKPQIRSKPKKLKPEEEGKVEAERETKTQKADSGTTDFNPTEIQSEWDEDYVPGMDEVDLSGNIDEDAEDVEEALTAPSVKTTQTLLKTSLLKNPFEAVFRSFCQDAIKKLKKYKQFVSAKKLTDTEFLKTSAPLNAVLSGIVRVDASSIQFADSLKNYQQNGVAWMLSLIKTHLGGVLASEPGLGKTRQAIEFIRQIQQLQESQGRPILVICPNSLVAQWKEELLIRAFCHRKQLIESLLNQSEFLSPQVTKKLFDAIILLITSQGNELKKLSKKLQELNGHNLTSLSSSSSSSSSSPSALSKDASDRRIQSKLQQIECLKNQHTLILEREKTAETLLKQAQFKFPTASLIISSWEEQIKDLSNELSPQKRLEHAYQRNKTFVAFLSEENIQTVLKSHLEISFKKIPEKPAIKNFKTLLKNELAKDSPNFSELEKGLNRAVDQAEIFRNPFGIRILIDFIRELQRLSNPEKSLIAAPAAPRLAPPPSLLELDDSLLSVDMYEQIVICTSDTAKTVDETLKNREISTKWKIAICSDSFLKEKNHDASSVKSSALKSLDKLPWQAVIWDEAHLFSSNLSGKEKGDYRFAFNLLKKLQERGAHRMLLTGTPFVNEYRETLSLVQLANPHLDLNDFMANLQTREARFSTKINKYLKALSSNNLEKLDDLKESLQNAFKNLFLGNEYLRLLFQNFFCVHQSQDPLIQKDWTSNGVVLLPKKISHVIDCDLTLQQIALLNKIDSKDKTGIVVQKAVENIVFHPEFHLEPKEALWHKKSPDKQDQALAKFIAASGFLTTFFNDDLKNPLTNAISKGSSILIIVPQIKHGETIKDILKKKYPKTQPVFFYGETSLAERDRMIKTFEENGSKPRVPYESDIMIISLKAGGVGLNVKTADEIFNLASWWNSAVNEQAEARALRAGVAGNKNFYTYDSKSLAQKRIKQVVKTKIALKSYFFSPPIPYTGESAPKNLLGQIHLYMKAYKESCVINENKNLEAEFNAIIKILSEVVDNLLPRLQKVVSLKHLSSSSTKTSPAKAPHSLSLSLSSSSSSSSSSSTSSSHQQAALRKRKEVEKESENATPKIEENRLKQPKTALQLPSTISRGASTSVPTGTYVSPLLSPAPSAGPTVPSPSIFSSFKKPLSGVSNINSYKGALSSSSSSSTSSSSSSVNFFNTSPLLSSTYVSRGCENPTPTPGLDIKKKECLVLFPSIHGHSLEQAINLAESLFADPQFTIDLMKSITELPIENWKKLLSNPREFYAGCSKNERKGALFLKWHELQSKPAPLAKKRYKQDIFEVSEDGKKLMVHSKSDHPLFQTCRILQRRNVDGSFRYDVLIKNVMRRET